MQPCVYLKGRFRLVRMLLRMVGARQHMQGIMQYLPWLGKAEMRW